MKKLAMIGCGGIGTYHLGHFLDYKDIELAGFCDLIPERAQSFVERAGSGKAYTDFRVMYDEVQPDMVFICVPPYCHGDIEFETIRRGIPMFIEKPVALDMELAYRIRDEIQKKRLITAVGLQCRYARIVDDTRAFVDNHRVAFVECVRMGGVPEVEWWRDKKRSGGQIVEQTIHNFDMVRYMMGEPVEVYTMGARGFVTDHVNYDTDDLSTTSVRFENGALGALSTGCYAKTGEAFDSKITFSAKDCRLEHYILGKVNIFGVKQDEDAENGLIFKGDGTMQAGKDCVTIKEDGAYGGIQCDRTFVDAVLSGDPSKIRSPYADAVRTMEFVMACNRSMETGLPVKVEHK